MFALFKASKSLLVFAATTGLAWQLGLRMPAYAESGSRLNAEIIEARIGADRRAAITLKISDQRGGPLALADLDRDSVKFTIAAVKAGQNGATAYHNYVLNRVAGKEFFFRGEARQPVAAEVQQPDFDRGGGLKQVRAGVIAYVFHTQLPADYDRNATHVIGGELTRDRGRSVANVLFEFVPSGAKVKIQRAVVEKASCNACHDPLQTHGGTRRNVGYCVLCHTSQLTDPESGESLELKSFVHKIHRGKMLPSVREGKPFFVVGANQVVKDYSSVRNPQAMLSDGSYKELRNCQACHADPQKDHWKRYPSVAACTSCHNNVDLATGKNHSAGPQAEGSCFACHLPEGPEFGPSIAGAHIFPGSSTQLPGIVFDILRVDNSKPGQNPAVTFSVKTKKGEPVDASKLDNARLVLAWPTTDFKINIEEDVRKAEALGDGIYRYGFKYALPADAHGSGAVGIQGYRNSEVSKPNGAVIKGVRDVGYNIVKYFAITDSQAVARRQAVKIENCNVCHNTLATHGEARRNAEFCVLCHHAGQTDEDKRKAAKGPLPAVNVHYKRLIHRVHTGAAAGESFIVYGGTPAKPGPVELGDIRFPGDRRNCVKCHVPGANEPPLPAGLLPSLIPQADGSVKALQPITSACIACHTKETAKIHVDTMTAQNGQEACVTCHGVGRSFAVEKVHRR